MVSSLVLIAPSGLQRSSHISWTSKFLYSERWFPESWLEFLVKRRLRGTNEVKTSTTPNEHVLAEVPKEEERDNFSRAALSRSRQGVTVASVVVSLYTSEYKGQD